MSAEQQVSLHKHSHSLPKVSPTLYQRHAKTNSLDSTKFSNSLDERNTRTHESASSQKSPSLDLQRRLVPINSQGKNIPERKALYAQSVQSSPLTDLGDQSDADSGNDHAAPVSNQSVELSTQSNVIDSQGHDLLPVKRKPGRPRKIPLPPGYVPPQPVQRRPKKLPKVYSSDSSSKSNKSKKAHKHSKRRDSYASESGSTSTPQDLDAVYLPGRKRPINPSAINLQDRSGRTLIFKYSARGDVETTTSLLKAGAVLHIADYAGWTPLHEACLNGHAEIVDLMLIHGADVNARGGDGDTPLHDAVGNGHLEVVKILLRYGASFECTNESGQTALEFAQEVHHSTLKEKDITPDQIENASSIILVLKDWARMTKKIVKRDDEGQTLLHHAAIKGSIDRISNLLWYGCDINAQDNAGVTPLHDGCLHGNADVVEKLLAFGANMDILNHEGQSCMHDAIANNHYECVKVLLKYGFKNSQSVVPKAHYRFECKILLEKPADFWKPNSIPEYHPRVIDTSKPIEAHKSKPKLPEDPTVPYPFAWGGLDKKKPGAFESTREEKKFHAFLKSLEKNEEKKAPSSLMMRLDIDTEGSNLSTDMTNIKIKRSYNRKNVDSSERDISTVVLARKKRIKGSDEDDGVASYEDDSQIEDDNGAKRIKKPVVGYPERKINPITRPLFHDNKRFKGNVNEKEFLKETELKTDIKRSSSTEPVRSSSAVKKVRLNTNNTEEKRLAAQLFGDGDTAKQVFSKSPDMGKASLKLPINTKIDVNQIRTSPNISTKPPTQQPLSSTNIPSSGSKQVAKHLPYNPVSALTAKQAPLKSNSTVLVPTSEIEQVVKPRKKKKNPSWLTGISGYQKAGDDLNIKENPNTPSALKTGIVVGLNPSEKNIALRSVESLKKHDIVSPLLLKPTNDPNDAKSNVTKMTISAENKFVTEAVEELMTSLSITPELSTSRCLPIYTYTLLSTQPKVRYVVCLQIALFLGYKNSRLFLDQFPALKLRVVSLNEKEALERTPLASSIFNSMIANGGNAKWLKKIDLPSGVGLSLSQYDLQFLEISEIQNLAPVLKRLESVGANITSFGALMMNCVLTQNGVEKDAIDEKTKHLYVHKLKRK